MELTGTVKTGGTLPLAQVQDGCGGQNRSPALQWSGVPAQARSLAVTMFDSDAKGGKGWWHWAIYNLPPIMQGLPENMAAHPLPLPGLAQGKSDIGRVGYAGACPPKGEKPHHYIITLWALDSDRVDVPVAALDSVVAAALKLHTLATATLTPVYARKP